MTKRIKHACGHQRLHDMSSFLLIKLGGGGGKKSRQYKHLQRT